METQHPHRQGWLPVCLKCSQTAPHQVLKSQHKNGPRNSKDFHQPHSPYTAHGQHLLQNLFEFWGFKGLAHATAITKPFRFGTTGPQCCNDIIHHRGIQRCSERVSHDACICMMRPVIYLAGYIVRGVVWRWRECVPDLMPRKKIVSCLFGLVGRIKCATRCAILTFVLLCPHVIQYCSFVYCA